MAATQAELDTITSEDFMCHWQFIKAVIEHRFGDLPRDTALERMSYFSGLDTFFCEIMLKEMVKEKLPTLLISFPKLGRLFGPWEDTIGQDNQTSP